MPKKGIFGAFLGAIFIIFSILLAVIIFFSQYFHQASQQIRSLGEANLVAESSKLETWVRSYQKAAELGYIQSLFDSGYGSILLPYEFEWNYSSSYLPYWQVYDFPLELCYRSESSEEYTIESSPSEFEDSEWNDPANAYASDDLRAYASPPSGTSYSVVYKGYSFDIPLEAEIERVEVGAEWNTSNPSYESLYAAVSWDGGVTWHEKKFPTQSSENLYFLDFTPATSWDRKKLSPENFSVRVRAYNSYVLPPLPCYPNSTYILTWNQTHYTFKSPEEIEVGELVPCFKDRLTLCRVVGKDKHFGNFELFDVYVGSTHILLTGNHPVWLPELNQTLHAKDLKKGMKVYYLREGKLILLPIKRIDKVSFEGFVYDVKLDKHAILFSRFKEDLSSSDFSSIEAIDFIPPKPIPRTVYLDWLPVRVTYKIERKFKCPLEIFENYFRQKISLISLNYLKNYLKDFEDLAEEGYPIDFLDGVNPQVLEITDDHVLIRSNEQLSFKRSFKDALGNEINLTRSTHLTSKIYTSFGKAIKKAIDILEKDLLGKCVRKEICDYSDEEELKNSLSNLAQSLAEEDLNLTFNLKNFDSGTAFIEVKVEDNTSSYVRYNFPKNLINESYLGLDFMVKLGSTQTALDQYKAKELEIFRECSDSHFGILGSKSDICNYFKEGSKFAVDEDEADPYLKGKCSDSAGDYEDVCFDSMLYEYKPFSTYKICYFERIKCDECKNGACKPRFCQDSDGLDYFTQGTVSYDGRTREDYCDGDRVKEYYCSNGYVSVQTYECPLDCYCQNGACNIPDSCQQLYNLILENYGRRCSDSGYNPVADLNKDGVVDDEDSGTFEDNKCHESWCKVMLSITSNPCIITFCGNGVCEEERGEDWLSCCLDCGCPEESKCCRIRSVEGPIFGFCYPADKPCPSAIIL